MFNLNLDWNKTSRLAILLIIGLSFCTLQGCAHYKLVGKGDPEELVPHQKTAWAFAWGLVQPKDIPSTCPSGAIDQVEVNTNLGFSIITTLTFGIVMPVKIQWHCSKENVDDDGSIGED